MIKQKLQSILAIIVFLAILTLLPLCSFYLLNKDEPVESSFPAVRISLNDLTLDEINNGSKDIIYDGNTLETPDGTIYNDIEIKGHGNTTWAMEKKPYQITFPSKVGFLGMAPEKKWILLANIYDGSRLRNDAGIYLEKMLDEKYAIDGRHVELYVNDEYIGLYFAASKVEIEKSRVNLSDEYGILVEMENLRPVDDGCYRVVAKECLALSDAVNDENAGVAMAAFVRDYKVLYDAAKNGDYEKFAEIADVDSFAEYFIISEFSSNPDAYDTSFFFYRDGLGEKISVGPGWDFDLAFGNRIWHWGSPREYHSPYNTTERRLDAFGGKAIDKNTGKEFTVEADLTISRLLYYLIDIPEFREDVSRIFKEKMSGKCNEFVNYLKVQSSYIRDAAMRDDERWNGDAFERESEYLIDWITKRFEYFELEYGDGIPSL